MDTECKQEQQCTFTSANILLLVNDQPLGGVSGVAVKDFKEASGNFTRISLNRVVFEGTQDLVELMRTQRFTFKLMNTTTSSGWYAPDAELETFEMTLSVEDILHQNLIIKTATFAYGSDISAEYLAATEEEDLKNLIEILKKNPEAAKTPAAVLPEDLFSMEPEEKKKKKKKNKK